MAREAVLLGGPRDGDVLALPPGRWRLEFLQAEPVDVAYLPSGARPNPEEPIRVIRHRYAWRGRVTPEGALVLIYERLRGVR